MSSFITSNTFYYQYLVEIRYKYLNGLKGSYRVHYNPQNFECLNAKGHKFNQPERKYPRHCNHYYDIKLLYKLKD